MNSHGPPASHLVDAGPARAAAGLAHRVLEPPQHFVGPRPAVVLLHGRGGDEDAMWAFARTLPPGCVVVAARALHPDPALGGYAWVPRSDWEWPELPRFAASAAAVARLARAMPALYGTDPARVCLLGFSQGAATAVAVAAAHPELVRGVAMLVGFTPEGLLGGGRDRPLAGLPVFMAAGRRDDLVPLARARAAAEVLRSAGADLAYREYDVGHKVGIAGIRDLKAWFVERLAG